MWSTLEDENSGSEMGADSVCMSWPSFLLLAASALISALWFWLRIEAILKGSELSDFFICSAPSPSSRLLCLSLLRSAIKSAVEVLGFVSVC